MNNWKWFMERVHFFRNGMTDSDAGRVTTEHPASSYGIPVIVMDDGTPIGPGDVIGGRVQAYGDEAEKLRLAGFTVVDDLKN